MNMIGVPLCCTPLTATMTGPSTAAAGTTTFRVLDVADVIVATTRRPLAVVKVTRLFAAVALKFFPVIVTGAKPVGPETGVNLVTCGVGGKVTVPVVAVGFRPTGASAGAA
jgi:hypothetical protein